MLVGKNEELLGVWTKVTPEEFEAIQDSLIGENYTRGAQGRSSLRLYYQDGFAAICTHGVEVGRHPNSM
jgi:hypothetical protein